MPTLDSQTRQILKDHFAAGQKPTAQDFVQLIDSFLSLIEDGVKVEEKKVFIEKLEVTGPSTFKDKVAFTGNVGIGTSTPLGPLSIGDSAKDGSDGFLVIGKRSTTGTRHFRVGFDDDFNFRIGDYGSNNKAASKWTSPFAIQWAAPDNSLFIDINGKSTLKELEVFGPSTFEDELTAEILEVAGSATFKGELTAEILEVTGPSTFKDNLSAQNLAAPRGALFLAAAGDFDHALYNNWESVDKEAKWDGAKWNTNKGLVIRVGSGTNKVPALSIDDQGKSTLKELEVTGPSTFKEKVAFTGNVGIGTSTPLGPLSIGDSAKDGSDGFLVIGKRSTTGTRHFRVGFDEAFNFRIGDYGSSNKAAAKWTSPFAIHWAAPDNSLFVDIKGNVGIGTNAPRHKLEVAGPVMQKLDVIACNNSDDWGNPNHPIPKYFKEKLSGRPNGTYVKAIVDSPVMWRKHVWLGWVDYDGKIHVTYYVKSNPETVFDPDVIKK